MAYPGVPTRRYKHVIKDYAVFRAGWWHIPTGANSPGVWYMVGKNNRVMRMKEPRIRNFILKPSFWKYVWDQWRLGEFGLW